MYKQFLHVELKSVDDKEPQQLKNLWNLKFTFMSPEQHCQST